MTTLLTAISKIKLYKDMINKRAFQQIHGAGQSQQEIDRRWLLFEQEQAAFAQQYMMPAAAGGGCSNTPSFQTITNTNWLYPPSDIDIALLNTTTPFTQVDNVLYFESIADMGTVYDEIFEQTAISQPIDNQGYSLGVGTILLDLYTELFFKLDTEELIVTWRLTKQLTNQADLPTPGESPDGTIGYLTVYENWPVEQRPEYYDPVLNQPGPIYCV